MNILHMTDFHHSAENQVKIIDIITCIEKKEVKIDLILFTGDLVLKGNKLENFKVAI
jgi:Icc-related predicted phosphoesterase